MYFPHYDTKTVRIGIDQVLEVIQEQGLITKEMVMSDIIKYCHCENEDYCACLPEELVFMEYNVKPNVCDTCGATGTEACLTSSGRLVSHYHKRRRVIE